MTQPKWIEPKISFGHILQALVLIGGGLIAFFELKADVQANDLRISKVEEIQAIELNHIKSTLTRIEQKVDTTANTRR